MRFPNSYVSVWALWGGFFFGMSPNFWGSRPKDEASDRSAGANMFIRTLTTSIYSAEFCNGYLSTTDSGVERCQ